MEQWASRLTGLHTADHAKVLDAIDEVRRQGAGEYVSLPQIVVCGDQSSGKSSVLQAISGVSFPVKTGACTRFATELSLRRAPTRSGSVRINPGPTASDEYKKHLERFQEQDVSLDRVGTYIEQAKEYMKISETNKFSDDVLVVEVKDPEFQPLTLIDLPGLIHSVVDDDNNFVRRLASSYLGEARSVILAIVHARSDIDNQEILKIIKDHDPSGKRTIGVITKADQIDPADIDQFSLLATNAKYRLQKGWHVVRNRGSGETSSFDQEAAEADAFRNEPWKGLLPAQLGIGNLRARLSKVLLAETCKHLEGVTQEVERQMAECEAELERLGPTRASPEEQRSFLTDIREKFRARVHDGVEGHYTNTYYEKHLHLRLRATIRVLNDKFDQDMHSRGHTFHIQEIMEKPTDGANLASPVPQVISVFAFLEMIDRIVVQTGRAQELPGRYNPDLVATVFRMQSENWKYIADEYAKEVSRETERFLLRILEGIIEPPYSTRIWTGLIKDDRLPSRQNALKKKVEELLKPFTDFLPFSTPQRYARGLTRFADMKSRLEAVGQEQKSVKDFTACTDLLIAMLAYYDSAMETFIDNMISLAVENCILYDLSNLIGPDVFATMKDDDLREYTEEPEDVVMRRQHISDKQKRLKRSLETFRHQVWTTKSSIVAPSGFSLGLIPGDDQIDDITAQMSKVQVQMPETPPKTGTTTPRTARSRSSEGVGLHQSLSKTAPPSTPTSSASLAPRASSSSLRPSSVPSSSFDFVSDNLTPGIMYPSPASSSASPVASDWRKRSPRRPSPQNRSKSPFQAESCPQEGQFLWQTWHGES
jgi:GTP-binding protein EngB required for normal cell division